jgi:hypothetical protein
LTEGIHCRWLSWATATKADVEAHFQTHGTGEITEIKLMNGFGFIEYKDAMDARDVVPGKLPTHTHPAFSAQKHPRAAVLPCHPAPCSSDALSPSTWQLANHHVSGSFPYVATSSMDPGDHHRDLSRLNPG